MEAWVGEKIKACLLPHSHGASESRPDISNDDILAHEKALKDEIAMKHPLISQPISTEALKERIQGGCHQIVQN